MSELPKKPSDMIAEFINNPSDFVDLSVQDGQKPAKKPAEQVGGSHYEKYGIQPIEVMREWFSDDEYRGFLRGSAMKYLARYRDKNGVEDLKKAQWYLDELVGFEKEQQ